MKLLLVVVVCLCAAQAYAECNAMARFKVKHQWQEAFGAAHHRLEFGLNLWNHIFHDHPALRGLFKRVHGDNAYSNEFQAHAQRVLSALDMTISLLDDQATLTAQLAHLKSQHDERDIKPEYYQAFTDELLTVLPDYLGTRLDFGAWTDCMKVITDGIKG
jgi:hemoglobin-like flavoprotein